MLYIVVKDAEEKKMKEKRKSTADKILDFYNSLHPNWKLPDGFELLFPFDNEDTWYCVENFYHKYFNDEEERKLILGINPGRFGAGITGVPFTDPKIIKERCGIDNPFPKKNELSAIFIYELVDGYGGTEAFYQDYFISSVCPLGFLKDGINCNYYDDKSLFDAVKSHIVTSINTHFDIGIDRSRVYCLGKGTNYKYLSKLNDEYQFFGEVIPLPHPRWVMQYRRKKKEEIAVEIIEKLRG